MPLPPEIEEMFDGEDDDQELSDERVVSERDGDEPDDLGDDGGEPERLGEDGEETEDDSRLHEVEDDEVGPDGVDGRIDARPNSRQRRSNGHYKEVAAERDRLRKEADELRQTNQRLASERQQEEARRAQALREQEQNRLATMLPDERNTYELQQIKAQLTYDQQMRVFEKADAMDAANYKATASVNPLYKRHEAEVEKSLAQLRKAGQNMPREVILRYCIGEEMLKTSQKNSKPLSPQKSRRVPKPTNSRADVSNAQRGRKPSSERERIMKQWGDTPL